MESKIKVFLSRPNPFVKEQQEFLKHLINKLNKFDIETVTLQAGNYDLTDSLNYLKGMIKQCYGAIVVGFKQIFIEKGTKKKGAQSYHDFFCSYETELSGRALSSPFCHIEGTIALLNDLPLLIMNEVGLWEEGILCGGRFSIKTQSFDLNRMDEYFADVTVDQQLKVWLGRVMDYYLFLNLKKI